MRTPKQYETVALLEDIPEKNLWRGQVGVIVEIYGDAEAFELEFIDDNGHTYALETIYADKLIPLSHKSRELIAA